MLDAVFHIHGDLLPGLKAEEALFQQRLIFRIADRPDGRHDITLQIDQPVDFAIDLRLQINNLANSVRHA